MHGFQCTTKLAPRNSRIQILNLKRKEYWLHISMPCSCISMFVTILFPSSKIISFYHQTTSFYDQTTSFYIKCSCFYDQIHRIYNQTTSFYDRIPVSTLNAQVSMTKLPESMIKLSVSMIKVPVSILNTQGLLNLPIRQPTNDFPII